MSSPPSSTVASDSPEARGSRLRFKICLIGDPGVGKTSLVARFVRDEFSEGYIHTIGTKVSKKELEIVAPQAGPSAALSLLIWDIMGQPAFRELLRDAYFHGASGVLGVADLTKPETLVALDDWVASVHAVEAGIPVVIALNKSDLAPQTQVDAHRVLAAAQYSAENLFVTSAKTGVGVEDAFRRLGALLLDRHG